MKKKKKSVEQIEKQNNNLMIYAIIGALLFIGFLFWFNSRRSLIAGQQQIVSPSPTPSLDSVTNQHIIQEVNQQRSNNNLSALRENEKLNNAATALADDMFANNFWGATDPTTHKTWTDFLARSSYYQNSAGLDLANGYATASDVVQGWMGSTKDKQNILSSNYSDIGVAVEYGMLNGAQTTIVVQIVASPQIQQAPVQSTSSIPAPTQPSEQTQNNNPTITCYLSYETAQMDYASCVYLQLHDPGRNNSSYPTLQPIPQMPTEQPTPILQQPVVQNPSPLPNVPTQLPSCTSLMVAEGTPCQQ